MRNLLLSLMVLASLVSCGKDNSVGAPVASVTNPVTNTDPSATNLVTMINNSTSYFPAVTSPTATFKIASTTGSAAQSNCEQKEGWWGIKYYVCSSSNNQNLTYTTVTPYNVDLAAKRNEIIGYINSASAGNIVGSGKIVYIRTTAGVLYTINMNFPLQLNPTAIQQVNGQTTYLYNQISY